jgi:hypothetical protein
MASTLSKWMNNGMNGLMEKGGKLGIVPTSFYIFVECYLVIPLLFN